MINTDFKNSIGINSKTDMINELNGFYISHFFKLMYNTIDVMKENNILFGDDSGEKIFREFLLNEYGTVMSSKFQLTNTMMDRYFQDKQNDIMIDVST
jgi:hypothetical protein